jgi:hypothetical protein
VQDLAVWLGELDDRNRDNVARTDAYLELYAWTRANGRELPWVLMAHLVSRNAGYLMSDLARMLDRPDTDAALADAMRNLFLLLERANWLIFHDAWHHVLTYLLGQELTNPRVPRFMIDAWSRHTAAPDERRLVLDLVHNEQHLIEHRAVHHAHLAAGARLLAIIEASGREKPLHFALSGAPDIRVQGFAQLQRRIEAGRRIYDEVIAVPARRDALFEWAVAHPHTGSRDVYGGKPGPRVREAWPVDQVRAMWPGVHGPMEPDPRYP